MKDRFYRTRYWQTNITAIIVVIVFFILSIPSWGYPSADIAFNSILAFSAMMCVAWAYLNRKTESGASNFLIVLFFRGIVHFGATVVNLFGDIPVSNSIFLDLVELFLLLLVMLLHFRYPAQMEQMLSSGPRILGGLLILLLFYGGLAALALPEIILVFIGIFLGAASLISGYWTLELLTENESLYSHVDRALLRSSIVFFTLSAIPLIVTIVIPSFFWFMSICLQMAGLLILLVGFSIPILAKLDLTLQQTIFVPLSISLLLIVPFLAAILVAGTGASIVVTNSVIYLLVRIGATILSVMMLYLVYSYSRINPKYIQYPLMLLFTLWSAIHLSIVVYFSESYYTMIGEPLSPYITGSLFVAILLLLGVIKLSDEEAKLPSRHGTRLVIWFMVVFYLGWLSQQIEFYIGNTSSELASLPISRSALLGVVFVTVFFYVILHFEVIRKERTTYSLETLVIGLLAMWLIPIILKGSFPSWTVGWWSAELLLVSGLVIGPFFLGFFYLQSMAEAEQARRMSSLLSDLLIHDVGNVTHAAMISLELAREGSLEGFDAAQDIAIDSLKQAKRIIENVRTLAKAEDATENLAQIDIIPVIWAGYQRAIAETLEQDIAFSVDAPYESCYIEGNELLTELFANLFSNAIHYSGDEKKIEVKIDTHDSYWKVNVIDNGKGISPEKRKLLFRRHMKGASGSGLGLSVVRAIVDHHHGTIVVGSRVPEDYTQGTVFSILLPRYEEE